MLFLNNAFTKDITEYDGEVLKEVKTVDGKIYLSNGAIIKEGVVGKFFDIATFFFSVFMTLVGFAVFIN